ncbi:MAG: VOC family protein [Litorimonas sp.]
MSGLRLNQVTFAAKDMAASVLFYEALGLIKIVDSAPRYVRFEFPPHADGHPPATLSLHSVEDTWAPTLNSPLIYFELDDVDAFIKTNKLRTLTEPTTQSYLWREADIIDPSGNLIRLYQAGENRRFPPWRLNTAS